MNSLWGIDLGGTKIEGAVLKDSSSTETVCRLRIPTEADRGYEHIVSRVAELVSMMENEVGAKAERIGIGTPGSADPGSGRMKNCNTTALNGRPLPTDLKAALGKEVIVANDANCFALAEAQLGAGRGADVVFGVIMGTGVGGGIVVHGRVLNGAQGIAGEWGHNVLEPNGQKCYCGKTGCVETVLAGPWLERHYEHLSGKRKPLKEIVDSARQRSDAHAAATLDRLCSKFGEAISVVVNILDPDVVILGGGVGNIDELYSDGVKSLEKWVFNSELRTRVVRPILGDSAGVFGAAHLCLISKLRR
ncbi:MAG TPA: ROK family protein [Fimbriimonas sp.]|nr:ROK family protein [Fimbriimonas sp.]